ncbi:aldo/keto reductase [Lientehia hominis]|uniref:aldo/keto reductase n=1 Tax=Lientehia hominis TaxID=2897778 RepID=UPI0022AA8E57|nr:aldo/keto reductase [Lientehia hominis]
MKYRKFGSSDLNVSKICMGFGDAAKGQHTWTLDEEHSREIIRRGLELGVNFYDTAIAYQSGTSEQYVGRALRDYAKHDEVVVATKFLPRTSADIEAGVSGQQHIERMIDKSLQNLGMDYVDLYIYHMWDFATPLYEIMDGLNRIVKAGKAAELTLSNEEISYLEEAYIPHKLVGVMAENNEKLLRAAPTWSIGKHAL